MSRLRDYLSVCIKREGKTEHLCELRTPYFGAVGSLLWSRDGGKEVGAASGGEHWVNGDVGSSQDVESLPFLHTASTTSLC